MPGFDGTGPRGLGPMTGGGRGYCASPLYGAGIANRGRRITGAYGAAYPGLSTQAELDFLRNEASLLQKELELIEVRIKSMESTKSE